MAVFEDIDIDRAECSKMVDVYFLFLSIPATSGNGLSHCCVIFVLSFSKQWGYKNYMISVDEIPKSNNQ